MPKQDIEYQGSSPDEIAILELATKVGYRILSKTLSEIVLHIKHKGIMRFRVMQKIDFTSERKRMSVVVECEEVPGAVFVFTKGADCAVYPLVDEQF